MKRHLPALGILVLACHACGDPAETQTLDAGVTTVSDADIGPTAAASVKVLSLREAPMAGVRIVFHDPQGKAVKSAVTGDDGVATADLPAGSGITMFVTGTTNVSLTSVLDVPLGGEVLFHLGRNGDYEPRFIVAPQLPPPPSGVGAARDIEVSVPCKILPSSGGDEMPMIGVSSICLTGEGTYPLVATLHSVGKVWRSVRYGIPSNELAPMLPAWTEVPEQPYVETDVSPGAVRFARDPLGRLVTVGALDEGELLFRFGDSIWQGLQIWHHLTVPRTAFPRVEFAPVMPRIPLDARFTRPATEITWGESEFGLPARFVFAELTWTAKEQPLSGRWVLIRKGGTSRIQIPEISDAAVRPPLDKAETTVEGRVALMDDTALGSYDELLAEDPLFSISESPARRPMRERDHVVSIAQTPIRLFQAPQQPKVMAIVTEPAAINGVVRVPSGTEVRLRATTNGADDARVQWAVRQDWVTQLPTFTSEGNHATLRLNASGRLATVTITSAIDNTSVAQILVVQDAP